jgi:hypothetical protein
MIKSFIVKPIETNSIEVRRHSTDDMLFINKTNHTFSVLEKNKKKGKKLENLSKTIKNFIFMNNM